jgi:glycosylphosphatidylinositol transamidase (GPIT) subunit GPI8
MKIALAPLFVVFGSAASNNFESIKQSVWNSATESQIEGFFSSGGHTNNWAVLVDTSRFWLNYRLYKSNY